MILHIIVYGLPRIVSNEKDINFIVNIKKDTNVGLTFCTGSLGVNKKNNHPIKQIPMRPDHGHTILHDQFNSVIPGYSLLGRMKGLDQLKGVIKAIN